MTSNQVHSDIFSAAMEAEVCRRVLGARRHGLDCESASVGNYVEGVERLSEARRMALPGVRAETRL